MACCLTFGICCQYIDSSISYAAELYFQHLVIGLTCDTCLHISVSTVTCDCGTFGRENRSKWSTRLPAWRRLMPTNMLSWLPGLCWLAFACFVRQPWLLFDIMHLLKVAYCQVCYVWSFEDCWTSFLQAQCLSCHPTSPAISLVLIGLVFLQQLTNTRLRWIRHQAERVIHQHWLNRLISVAFCVVFYWLDYVSKLPVFVAEGRTECIFCLHHNPLS